MNIFNMARYLVVMDSRIVCQTNDMDVLTELLRYMREVQSDPSVDNCVELFDAADRRAYFFSPWDAGRDGVTADQQFADWFGEAELASAVENLRRWHGVE